MIVEPAIAEYFGNEPGTERFSGVDRHDRHASIRVLEYVMAAADACHEETGAAQSGDQSASRELRPAHAAIRTR
jgi:hypothetical protein